ncbi:MAG: YfhO family protein, partial [Bacteroidota bacterium]|nr:YfhO family protein [Bacteroidota bacterium]
VSEAERTAFIQQAETSPEAQAQISSFVDSLKDVREGIFSSDAWRSLGFIVVAAIMIVLYGRGNVGGKVLVSSLGLLILIDLWSVDKRYLNNESVRGRYAQWEDKVGIPHKANAADLAILAAQEEDPSARSKYESTLEQMRAKRREEIGSVRIPADQDQLLKFGAMRRADHYRVLNLSSPFDDARTSYFHRSVGGYHGAKLKRYQELIEFHVGPSMQRVTALLQTRTSLPQIDSLLAREGVLNMLNIHYLIYSPERPPIQNLNGYGAGWFVNEIKWVTDPDQEIQALGQIDPAETVVIDERYRDQIGDAAVIADPAATVELAEYKTNELKYKVRSAQGGVVVFSEIWYGPDWKAYIDGQPADHVRGDYVLRVIRVPAGDHEVVFKIQSAPYGTSKPIMLASSLLLILLVLGMLGLELRAWLQGRRGISAAEA